MRTSYLTCFAIVATSLAVTATSVVPAHATVNETSTNIGTSAPAPLDCSIESHPDCPRPQRLAQGGMFGFFANPWIIGANDDPHKGSGRFEESDSNLSEWRKIWANGLPDTGKPKNQAAGWLQKGCNCLGGGTVLRFP